MYLEPVLSSLLIAKIRKGKLSNLLNLELKGWYLFFISAVIQFISNIAFFKLSGPFAEFVVSNFVYIHAITFILILVGLVLNFPKQSMIVLFIGTLLNFAVITANDGAMPVVMDEYSLANIELDIRHSILDETTRLPFLADIIKIPRPYPFPQIISIGDVFIMIGVFMFIQELLVGEKRKG